VNDPGEYLRQNGLLHRLPSKLKRPGRHEGHFALPDLDLSEIEELSVVAVGGATVPVERVEEY